MRARMRVSLAGGVAGGINQRDGRGLLTLISGVGSYASWKAPPCRRFSRHDLPVLRSPFSAIFTAGHNDERTIALRAGEEVGWG